MKTLTAKLITVLTTTLILTGCMPDSLTKFKKNEAKKEEAAAPTNDTPKVDTSPTAPPNLNTLSMFELKNITQNNTSYHLHKYGAANASAACQIPMTSLADGSIPLTDQSNDILCWLEADEVQLFFNGADFQVNAPIGQCDYVQIKPYYFWSYAPINTKKTVSAVSCDDPSSLTCMSNGGVQEPVIKCEGDYTTLEGPNCDEGYVKVNTKNIVGIEVTFETSTRACGGRRTNCYGGPGVDFDTSKNGYPIPKNYLAYSGESINYSVSAPGPLGKGFKSNHYISNYTQTFSTGLKTYDYTTIGSSTGMELYGRTSSTMNTINAVDIALDPLKRADAFLRRTGLETWETLINPVTYIVQPFYEFSCLTYASEVKGRIRLQVREWNQKFTTPVTSEVTESAPVKLLKQSTSITDYETSGVGFWNDVTNWDTPYEYGPNTGFVPPIPTAVGDSGFKFPNLGSD